MTITIPNIESLPPGHHLNQQIDGLNRDQRMDNVFRASVATAMARFLAERHGADLDWIREVKLLIVGIELHTPTVENSYADLLETDKVMVPDTQVGHWSAYAIAIIVSLVALYYFSHLYKECKLGWSGNEMQASVVQIPEQSKRSSIKYLYVSIDSYYVPVMISSQAYAQKRFQVGQVIEVKYHEASGGATLSGEINGVLLFFFGLMGSVAAVLWINIYKTVISAKN